MTVIKATIDRFEGQKAVLTTEDKESIIWPKSKLPKGASEGDVFRISLHNDKAGESADRELAKSILNEILDTDN